MTQSDTYMWLRVVLCMLSSAITGFDMGFNVYALSVKETFNFTQTEVEVTASMCTIGFSFSFLQGVMLQAIGYTSTSFAICILASLPSGLFALAVHYRQQVQEWPIIVYSLQLFLSTALAMLFVMTTNVCVKSVKEVHSGKVVTAMFTSVCTGKIIFGVLKERCFPNDLQGFFLALCTLSVVIFGLTLFVLIPEGKRQENTEEPLISDSENSPSISLLYPTTRLTKVDILKSPYFHLIFWSCSALFGCTFTCLNNITAFAQALGLTDPSHTVYVIAVSIVVTRVLCGCILGYCPSVSCGLLLLMLANVGLIFAMALCMAFLGDTVIFLATFLIGVAQGVSAPVTLAVLVFCFGRDHYASVTQGFFVVSTVFQVILQIITGILYDSQTGAQITNIHTCHGRKCFFWTFAMIMCIIVFVSFFHVASAFKVGKAKVSEEMVKE